MDSHEQNAMQSQNTTEDPIVASGETEELGFSAERENDNEPQEQEVDNTNWREEARKFQGLYDKTQAELQELEDAKQLKQLFMERPDLVEVVQSKLNGTEQQETVDISPSDFDPWDAYYKPDSPSYQKRIMEEKALIENSIQSTLGKVQEQMTINNIRNELQSNFKMSKQEADAFLQFATAPKEQVPLEVLVDVYRRVNGKQVDQTNAEVVQRTQQQPRTAGILQGGEPQNAKLSDVEQLWNDIKNAGGTGSIP